MSLFLTAFPLAFLTNPSKNKTVNLTKLMKKYSEMQLNQESKLYEVKVLTNLTQPQVIMIIGRYAEELARSTSPAGKNTYKFKNGLQIEFEKSEQHYNVILSGNLSDKGLLKFSEELFNIFDEITHRNVRDIGGYEKFYYRYKTDYNNLAVLKKELRKNNISDMVQISDNELTANIDGKNIRFYKNNEGENFSLELEQKIALMNIGLSNYATEVEIKTNIKPEELKDLLSRTIYYFDSEKSSIQLNSGNTPVKFELQNGYYSLKYESKNITAERKEIEDLFVTMNKIAKRDLRLVDNKTYANYAYKTNYTDKGILINTLLEHGAKNLFEEDGNIYCDLFDMQMAYKRINENSPYILEIMHVQNKSECENFISDINDEYGLNIQELTYRKIKERLQKENMRLENEEINDDNSIVLTIDIG